MKVTRLRPALVAVLIGAMLLPLFSCRKNVDDSSSITVEESESMLTQTSENSSEETLSFAESETASQGDNTSSSLTKSSSSGNTYVTSSNSTTSSTSVNKYSETPSTKAELVKSLGMCVTDIPSFYSDDSSIIAARFNQYKNIGIKTVRLETGGWGSMEQSEGVWTDLQNTSYLFQARNNGMRIKYIGGIISSAPSWFFEKYPNAKMINSNGREAIFTISYWYPDLMTYMREAVEKQVQWLQANDLLDYIDAMVVDFGPAGEPIYPAAWTQGEPAMTQETFWCYDAYAQKDFVEKMQTKYGTIASANNAWGKSYSSWDEVSVPKPRTITGQMWRDVLEWYRASKNAFIAKQVAAYKEVVKDYTDNRVKLIMYIPGSDVSTASFEEAVATGDGDGDVKLMSDFSFLIDTAANEGCYLQYTGLTSEEDVQNIMSYIQAKGYSIPVFGENADAESITTHPANLSRIVRQYGLDGIDYTHTQYLFSSVNHIVTTSVYDEFVTAMTAVKEYLDNKWQ